MEFVRRWFRLGALVGLAFGAAGCTGTFETLPPLLLIASLVEGGVPQLALIEDTYLTEEEVAERFLFLESSRRDLPAPAVAFDLVDRSGSRNRLMVLSRGPAQTDPDLRDFEATLTVFNLDGIDPADPSAFEAVSSHPVSEILDDQLGIADACLAGVQSSRRGRYAVLFEDRGKCVTGDTLRAIYVLDLDTDTVVTRIDTEPVLAAGVYVEQSTDRAYYLNDAVAKADLRSFELPSGRIGTVTTLEGADQVDLGPVEDLLVALRPSSFEAVDLDAPRAERRPVQTTASSRTLIRDDFGVVPVVLILGTNRFTVHTSVADEEEQSLTVTATGGTLESGQRFVYLLEAGAIRLFDLLRYEGSFSGTVERFPIPELTSPGLLTWVRTTVGSSP